MLELFILRSSLKSICETFKFVLNLQQEDVECVVMIMFTLNYNYRGSFL